MSNLQDLKQTSTATLFAGEPVISDTMARYLGASPAKDVTVNDLADAIRNLKDIQIEECAVIVRALSGRLRQRQKGFKSENGIVYCPLEMAVEQLDCCADLVSEAAVMNGEEA